MPLNPVETFCGLARTVRVVSRSGANTKPSIEMARLKVLVVIFSLE